MSGAGGFALVALTGVALAGLAIFLLRSDRPWVERRRWAWGLVVVAGIYVGFAAAGGLTGTLSEEGTFLWLLVEAGGLGFFAALALLGGRHASWVLAAGWTLHVFWDLGLHGSLGMPGHDLTPFVPAWYPPLCLGFDLAVAAWLVWRGRVARAAG